jgi:hypothetical protein
MRDVGRDLGRWVGCFGGEAGFWGAGFGFSNSQCVKPPFTKRAGSSERSLSVVYCVKPFVFASCWNQTRHRGHATGQNTRTHSTDTISGLTAAAGQWDEIC